MTIAASLDKIAAATEFAFAPMGKAMPAIFLATVAGHDLLHGATADLAADASVLARDAAELARRSDHIGAKHGCLLVADGSNDASLI